MSDIKFLVAAGMGDLETVKTFVESDIVDVDCCQGGGSTPLGLAASSGYIEIMEYLLSVGADIDLGSPSPLCLAARHGQRDAVKCLVSKGAQLDLAGMDGRFTAIQVGMLHAHLDVVRCLFESGADFDLEGIKEVMTPLQVKAATEIVMRLKAELETNTPLVFAAKTGRLGMVRCLITQGIDPNQLTVDGFCTPLIAACAHDRRTVIQFLIKAGADVNLAAGMYGRTPLLFAAATGSLAAVECLLKAGADPRKADANGDRPLLVAARNGHGPVVWRLLSAGVMELGAKVLATE